MVSMLVMKALGFEPQGDKKRDVSCVFGRWDPTEAAEFENNTSIFRRIDDEIWK